LLVTFWGQEALSKKGTSGTYEKTFKEKKAIKEDGKPIEEAGRKS